ncbi:patatin-like protein [Motilibacter deserti]|uniref:Patatin-like protein n=1 Tax=Motilibacter deserti TaxID=2714956 RepID=A0ABX0GXC8_9ACTN|nr:patatin-like protein [Motilibacter deserti]NHC15218.1 patatin-like protein [Motilibacter deserti]
MDQPTEVRVALVMNGGVSLAVWMGGVAHEIDLLRRASQGILPPPAGSPDLPVYDGWRELCRRLNVTVTVDVVAGTSAGGLNGALLATAIGRGAPLPGLREVWSDVAQLGRGALLRANETAPVPSLLDGDYFSEQVRGVFDRVGGGRTDPATAAPVTLFVTATALGGPDPCVVDSSDDPFPVADHRRLYRFSHDGPRRSYAPAGPGDLPADPVELFPRSPQEAGFDDTPALSRAARASAGFPVAFAPVREQDDTVDLLAYRVRPQGSDSATWLIDGGVLDNAPFDPVLDEIARRPVDRPWKRVLAYVMPSGSEPGTPAQQLPPRPAWLKVLLTARGLPGEADLRNDIERLRTLSREAERWARQPQLLFAGLRDGREERADHLTAARQLLRAYRQSRVDGGVVDALWVWAGASAAAPVTLGQIAPQPPDAAVGWVPGPGEDALERSATAWEWGTAVADRVLRLLLRDVGAATRDVEPAARERCLQRLSDVLECVAALREQVNAGIATAPDRSGPPAALTAINAAVAAVDAPRVLCALVGAGARAYSSAVHGTEDVAHDVVVDALVVEVLTRAFAGHQAFERPVGFDFLRLGPDVRSPLVPGDDNTVDADPGPRKLWGTQLLHFGAFGRAQWRQQDWLWGRLDGAAHLARLLDHASDAAERPTVADATAQLQQAVLAAESSSVAQVTADLRVLLQEEPGGQLARWRADEAGRDTLSDSADTALQLLRSREAGVPAVVPRLGDLASTVLADRLPPDLARSPLRRVAHWMAGPLVRRRFRRWVRGEGGR